MISKVLAETLGGSRAFEALLLLGGRGAHSSGEGGDAIALGFDRSAEGLEFTGISAARDCV